MLLLLNHNLQQRSIPESQERQDLTVHELFVICTTMCFNFALAPDDVVLESNKNSICFQPTRST